MWTGLNWLTIQLITGSYEINKNKKIFARLNNDSFPNNNFYRIRVN
jgi:hypothetical protein